MKVKSLSIKDFNQFKDFELDLTYPAGHPKAGLPLDKVCIIGQSGTGKTSLLVFIKMALDFLEKQDNLITLHSPLPLTRLITGQPEKTILTINNTLIKEDRIAISNQPGTRLSNLQRITHNFLQKAIFGYIYYPAYLIDSYKESDKQEILSANESEGFMAVDLSLYDAPKYWNRILEKIQKYQEVEIQKRIELSEILQNPNISLEELNQARQKFGKWFTENFNPLEDLANNFLDDILRKFNLRTRKKLSFNGKEDLGNIKIETLQGIEVPLNAWSTGTKHLIFSILPLYGIKPEKKLLLFDEPERSLYPDIQTEIID
ncbi:hypothetical protein DAPPUDRAFT_343128, partial [Daphnia pulex]